MHVQHDKMKYLHKNNRMPANKETIECNAKQIDGDCVTPLSSEPDF